jgi:hypothetical protein
LSKTGLLQGIERATRMADNALDEWDVLYGVASLAPCILNEFYAVVMQTSWLSNSERFYARVTAGTYLWTKLRTWMLKREKGPMSAISMTGMRSFLGSEVHILLQTQRVLPFLMMLGLTDISENSIDAVSWSYIAGAAITGTSILSSWIATKLTDHKIINTFADHRTASSDYLRLAVFSAPALLAVGSSSSWRTLAAQAATVLLINHPHIPPVVAYAVVSFIMASVMSSNPTMTENEAASHSMLSISLVKHANATWQELIKDYEETALSFNTTNSSNPSPSQNGILPLPIIETQTSLENDSFVDPLLSVGTRIDNTTFIGPIVVLNGTHPVVINTTSIPDESSVEDKSLWSYYTDFIDFTGTFFQNGPLDISQTVVNQTIPSPNTTVINQTIPSPNATMVNQTLSNEQESFYDPINNNHDSETILGTDPEDLVYDEETIDLDIDHPQPRSRETPPHRPTSRKF